MAGDEVVISLGEACALLGVFRRSLPRLEQDAGVASVPGRSGYTIEELRAMIARLKGSLSSSRPACSACGEPSDRMRLEAGGAVYGCTKCGRWEAEA